MLRDTTPTAIAFSGQAADDGRVAAVYLCRVPMEELQATNHLDIKYCDECEQKVLKVNDFYCFEKVVASRGCVWGSVIFLSQADEESGRLFFGGASVIPYGRASTLTWEDWGGPSSATRHRAGFVTYGLRAMTLPSCVANPDTISSVCDGTSIWRYGVFRNRSTSQSDTPRARR